MIMWILPFIWVRSAMARAGDPSGSRRPERKSGGFDETVGVGAAVVR